MEKECPIGLDKIHCQNCYFMKKKCAYREVVANKRIINALIVVCYQW